MGDDIPTLLRDAAADPSHTPDFDALAVRGRRQHLAARAGTALVAVVALVVGGIVLWPERDPGRMPAIGEQPGGPSGQEPSGTGQTEGASSPWQEPQDYDYTLASCGGGSRLFAGTFRIEVRDHEVVSIEPLSDYRGPGDAVMLLQEAPTIGDLLARVEQARQQGAAVAEVTDGESGQPPVRIELDPRSNAVDDEECYEIRDYVPLGPDAIAASPADAQEPAATKLEGLQIQTIAYAPTDDTSLEGQIVEDAQELAEVWQAAQMSGRAPDLPDGTIGVFVIARQAESTCRSPDDVVAVEILDTQAHVLLDREGEFMRQCPGPLGAHSFTAFVVAIPDSYTQQIDSATTRLVTRQDD